MKDIDLKIVYLPISAIQPYRGNAKKHTDKDVDVIASSIKEFGFSDAIGIWSDKNIVVEGHGRLLAAKKLGMTEVPCVRLDHLSDEERRAYTIVHNRSQEIATWDAGKLEEELDEILDIDMDALGFGVPDIDLLIDEIDEEKENERTRTYKSTNFDMYDEYRVEGKYDMPVIQPVDYVPDHLIGFNYAKTTSDYDAGIHFFLDDYQFERVWNTPKTYLPMLGKFDCCLTPTFSIYLDMPAPIKIWNTYRSRLLGQIMQDYGIITIPIVYWSDETSYEYCFDGLPEKGTLAVNNIGNSVPEAKYLWDKGMDELIKRKNPKRILLYGNGVEEDYDFGHIEVKKYRNDVTERMNGKNK